MFMGLPLFWQLIKEGKKGEGNYSFVYEISYSCLLWGMAGFKINSKPLMIGSNLSNALIRFTTSADWCALCSC